QFGTGAFLRAFAGYFIDEANRAGGFDGSMVAIPSPGGKREAVLNAQDGLYTLSIQGGSGPDTRPRHRIIASMSRALSAATGWDAVRALPPDPAIETVRSHH